jgi:hypothetical protein
LAIDKYNFTHTAWRYPKGKAEFANHEWSASGYEPAPSIAAAVAILDTR